MCTLVAEFSTQQNVLIMTTDFMEDWPHKEVRLRLEMSVNADELDELCAFIESVESSDNKNTRVYEELMDLLLLAKRAMRYYTSKTYSNNETD